MMAKRMICENLGCGNGREFYCRQHERVYCCRCRIHVHSQCDLEQIGDEGVLLQTLEEIKMRLRRITEFDDVYQVNAHFVEFSHELEVFQIQFRELKKNVKEAVEEDKFLELKDLIDESLVFIKNILGSRMFCCYANYKEDIEACSWMNMPETNLDKLKKQYQNELNITKDQIQKHLERDLKTKVEHKMNELNQDFQNKLEQRSNEIDQERNQHYKDIFEDKIRENEETNLKQTEKIKKLEKDLKALDSNCKTYKIQAKDLLSEQNKLLNLSSKLTLDLSRPDDQTSLINHSELKQSLMKRISIKHISSDKDTFIAFMQQAFPQKLKLLSLNEKTGIFTDSVDPITPYMDCLKQCLPNVNKEIWLRNFELDSTQIQDIIKACANVERLKFRLCCINSDIKLDLDPTIRYNIKYMDFSWSGHSKRTDWKSNTIRLSNIIKGICNSQLKESLLEIGFSSCQYEINKIEKMLKDCGVTNIKITENGWKDLED